MNKPNLLLLPGLLNDDRLWKHQISGLTDIATVIVADLSNADTMAGLASAVLKQAPSGNFALAGISMGGYVALEIMRQAPERVSALALLDTTARPDTPESIANRQQAMRLAQTDFAAVIDSLIPKSIHPSHLKDVVQVEIIKAMAQNLGKEVFVRQQKAIIGRIDSRPSLQNIHCPTLILCGREDAITPVDAHEKMNAAIPNSKFIIVENCGHLSPIGQPEKVTDALREWINAAI